MARQQQLKTAAVAAKRQGDMSQARELLVQLKDVQALLQLLQPSQQIATGTDLAAPPPARDTPVTFTQTPRLAKSAATTQSLPGLTVPQPHKDLGKVLGKDLGKDSVMGFAAMKEELDAQTAKASRLATYFLKAGDKPTALEFHRLKKRAATDLATVSSYEANGRSLPPPFSYKEVQWSAPVEQRRDISANELQIAVGRLVSDGDLAATLGGKSDFFVQWELGWPRDKGHKAYTRTVKYAEFEASRGDLEIDYSRNVDFVDRQHTRPFVRWLDRGRLTVELYKYMGLIWGSQLIGRASLPLSELRTKSEAAALLEIKAGSDGLGRTSKPLPGGPIYVDVAARLRLPLSNKPEIESHVERWIYVESPEQQLQLQMRHEPAITQPDTIQQDIVQPDIVRPVITQPAAAPVDSAQPVDVPADSAQPVADETSADDIAAMLDEVDGL
ncbi:hypothetical protein GGI21_005060, partial [Coemansia aciculifera]